MKVRKNPMGKAIAMAFLILILLLMAGGLLPGGKAKAAEGVEKAGGDGLAMMAAAIAAAGGAIAAAIAVSTVGASALGVMAEKPELFGRILVFVGLAEGIAIYGLIVSIMILSRV